MSDNVIEIRKPTELAADVLGRFYQVYEEGFRAIRWLAHAIERMSMEKGGAPIYQVAREIERRIEEIEDGLRADAAE